jgi:Cu(I)/Ag(I) efflux system membrane fusion protein/cobalt-zinc-cadmium efflux system membrane fusion protein
VKKKIVVLLIFLAVIAVIIAAGCSKEQKTEQVDTKSAEMNYVCPMHPEVVSAEKGVCPKCNMYLVHKDSLESGDMHHMPDSTKQAYICPMHPEVTSDKPGVCPKCNMNLELQEASSTDSDTQDSQSSIQQYTCGMHPQIVQNEPGLCPICNMKLVPKSDVMKSGGKISVDAETQKKMGIALSQAAYRDLSKVVRAFGNVTYSEPNLYSVNIKFNGWVEVLYVNESGIKVAKGAPLMEIYSPELVAAQEEYLIAWKTMMAMHESDTVPTRLVSAAIEKLKNWDITDEQIQELALSKKTKRTLVIKAPYNGTVIMKDVKEGDNVMAGQELFKVADLSTVWVSAYIYEQDLPFVNKGQTAEVTTSSAPGERFRSVVFYVSPFLESNRQAEIRLSVENPEGLLKPNMYAEVGVRSTLSSENLSVPRSAVIKTGTRELVFVANADGTFQARQVTTGGVGQNDMIEIMSGLHNGEFVVTTGQFMLDSETRLHESIANTEQTTKSPGHVH